MGFLGFPSRSDMSEMFGFVTPEDRKKWEQDRTANQQKQSPGTANDMAKKSAAPAMDLAKKGVQAQMHGAQTEAQRGAQPKEWTRERIRTQSRNLSEPDSDSDSDYGPDF